MTVYLCLRRGKWASRMMAIGMPCNNWLMRRLRRMGSASWMSCAVTFTQECRGGVDKQCEFCANPLSKPADAKKRGYHTLTLDANPEHGVQALVDQPLDDRPECFLWIELPAVTNAAALKFFKLTSDLKYNYGGFVYNFMTWPWGRSNGVQADCDVSRVKRVFCSEAICAFLQVSGYAMDLVPCTTTPQQLAEALVYRYPALVKLQFHINPLMSASASLRDRLVRVAAPAQPAQPDLPLLLLPVD